MTEGNQVTFTITRSGDKPAETVYFSTLSDGTATYGEGDYATTSGGEPKNIAVTFSSGTTSKTVTLNILNDGVSDSGEQFRAIVQRSGSDPASTYLDRSSYVTINDAAQSTSYSLTPSATTVTEGNQVTFTITRSGDKPAETVYFSTLADGTATYGEGDYATTSGGEPKNVAVTFSSGTTSKTVTLNILNDGVSDSGEQFRAIVQRSGSDPASTYLDRSAYVTINDAAQSTSYSLTPSATTVTEGNQVTFTITRSGDKPAETVYFSTLSDGTATYGEGDYTTTSGGEPKNIAVSFASGATSQAVTLNILNDGVSDSGEQFRAIVQRSASDSVSTYLDRSSYVTINDATQSTSYALTPSATTVTEGNQVTFTVTRSGDKPAETVYFSTLSDGTATYAAGDYTTTSGGEPKNIAVIFAAGATSQAVTLNILNDGVSDSGEQFRAIVQRNASDAVSTYLDRSGYVTINDATSGISYSVSANPNPVSESAGTVTFTITRSGSFPAETLYASTVNGAANGYAANSGDYATNVNSLPVAFASGVVSKTVTVSVTNDSAPEAEETFGFIIQRNSDDPVSTRLAVTSWTIHDDDQGQATSYAISPGSLTVNENAGTATFTVTRSGTLPGETIYLSTVNGAANGYPVNNGDYVGRLNDALTFSTGQTSKDVTVSLVNDSVAESDETFGLVVQRNSSDPLSVFLAKSTFTIHDDDTQGGTYSITPTSTVIDEGAGTATFTVTRPTSALAETLFVSTVQTEGSVNSGDYAGIANQALSFTAGQASKTVTLSIVDDGVVDGNETFGLIVQRSGSDPITAYLAKSTFTIHDNDSAQSSLSVSIAASAQVNENAGDAVIRLSLSQAATQAVSVQFYTSPGTASSATKDYEGVIDQTVTFKPGEQFKDIHVHITDDKIHENSETFTVKLENPQGLTIGSDHATVTITDDDAATSTVTPDSSLVFMATLAEAAYHLLPNPYEISGSNNNSESSTQNSSYMELQNKVGFHLLTSADLPSLSRINMPYADFPIRGLTDGIYTDKNSAVLLGQMGDALYIAFRGTNDTVIGPDHVDWANKSDYYSLLSDVIIALDGPNGFIATEGIKHVFVTGHSLGAAAAQKFMTDHVGSMFSAITFANPGYGVGLGDIPDDRINNIRMQGDIITIPDFLEPIRGDKYIIDNNIGESIDLNLLNNLNLGSISLLPAGISAISLHSMDLYYQVAVTLQNIGYNIPQKAFLDGRVNGPPHPSFYIDNSTGQWKVSLPGATIQAVHSGDVFFSTPSDDSFFSSLADGLYSTAHTTASVLINLAPNWVFGGAHSVAQPGPLGADAQFAAADAEDPANQAGFAQGEAIGTDRLVGIESILTGSGDDQIFGDDNANVIQPGAGNDMVSARGGDDFIISDSGDGNDTYDGGDGSDTVDYSSTTQGVAVDLSLSQNQATGNEIGVDQLTGIENIVGGAGDDIIRGDSGANTFEGLGGNDRLLGGDGDDVLSPGSGRDVVDGGPGSDTLVLGGVRGAYSVVSAAGQMFLLGGADGVQVSGVETVRFADATVAWGSVAAGATAFDALRYLASNPDLARAYGADAAAGAAHFVNAGFAEGRATASFDPLAYLAANRDLIAAFGADAAAAETHYIRYGLAEGRATSGFDALRYLASNPDLARAYGTDVTAATAHFVIAGFAEGRSTTSFDPLRYLASNLDLAHAYGTDAVAAEKHYIGFGLAEGRSTTSFDPLRYLASNPDLARAYGTDITAAEKHYIGFGLAEGRSATSFDPLRYLASNPDLARVYGTDITAAEKHYIGFGLTEGRSATSFDPLRYLASNLDLLAAYGADTVAAEKHYIGFGLAEGRSATSFDPLLYAATNIDLARAYGKNATALEQHFVQFGYHEGRQAAGFDSVAYLLANPDLAAAGLGATGALDHWILYGIGEGRTGDAPFGREQASHLLTSSRSDTLATAGDRDWFQLTLAQGQHVRVDLTSATVDGVLSLHDASGRTLVLDDGSAPGNGASVTYTASAAGTYYLTVNDRTGTHAGSYALTLGSGSSSAAAPNDPSLPDDPTRVRDIAIVAADDLDISTSAPLTASQSDQHIQLYDRAPISPQAEGSTGEPQSASVQDRRPAEFNDWGANLIGPDFGPDPGSPARMAISSIEQSAGASTPNDIDAVGQPAVNDNPFDGYARALAQAAAAFSPAPGIVDQIDQRQRPPMSDWWSKPRSSSI